MLLGNEGAWEPIFPSALLEPTMVLPVKFYQNRPSLFSSRQGFRLRRENLTKTPKIRWPGV